MATTDDDTRRYLNIYLRDHLAGSSAGLALAKRCRDSNRDTPIGDDLARLADEIAEDRRSLESMMGRFAVAPNYVKSLMGAVAERAGRLKANGRLVGYSPLSRLLELEALTSGIAAKRDLWRSLALVADDYSQLDRAELEDLIERATSQLDRVHDLHAAAAREALAPS